MAFQEPVKLKLYGDHIQELANVVSDLASAFKDRKQKIRVLGVVKFFTKGRFGIPYWVGEVRIKCTSVRRKPRFDYELLETKEILTEEISDVYTVIKEIEYYNIEDEIKGESNGNTGRN